MVSAVARRARGPGIFSQQIDVLWRCLHGRGRPLAALPPGADGQVSTAEFLGWWKKASGGVKAATQVSIITRTSHSDAH
jgi:hypothetical protein